MLVAALGMNAVLPRRGKNGLQIVSGGKNHLQVFIFMGEKVNLMVSLCFGQI